MNSFIKKILIGAALAVAFFGSQAVSAAAAAAAAGNYDAEELLLAGTDKKRAAACEKEQDGSEVKAREASFTPERLIHMLDDINPSTIDMYCKGLQGNGVEGVLQKSAINALPQDLHNEILAYANSWNGWLIDPKSSPVLKVEGHDIAFSPDSQKLYIQMGKRLGQYTKTRTGKPCIATVKRTFQINHLFNADTVDTEKHQYLEWTNHAVSIKKGDDGCGHTPSGPLVKKLEVKGNVVHAEYSPGKKYILVTTQSGSTRAALEAPKAIYIFSTTTWELVKIVPGVSRGVVNDLTGSLVYIRPTGEGNGLYKTSLTNSSKGEEQFIFKPEYREQIITDFVISPDGATVAVVFPFFAEFNAEGVVEAAFPFGGAIALCSMETNTHIHTVRANNAAIETLLFSPNGGRLAAFSFGGLMVFEQGEGAAMPLSEKLVCYAMHNCTNRADYEALVATETFRRLPASKQLSYRKRFGLVPGAPEVPVTEEALTLGNMEGFDEEFVPAPAEVIDPDGIEDEMVAAAMDPAPVVAPEPVQVAPPVAPGLMASLLAWLRSDTLWERSRNLRNSDIVAGSTFGWGCANILYEGWIIPRKMGMPTHFTNSFLKKFVPLCALLCLNDKMRNSPDRPDVMARQRMQSIVQIIRDNPRLRAVAPKVLKLLETAAFIYALPRSTVGDLGGLLIAAQAGAALRRMN
jgi:hypothetical protein